MSGGVAPVPIRALLAAHYVSGGSVVARGFALDATMTSGSTVEGRVGFGVPAEDLPAIALALSYYLSDLVAAGTSPLAAELDSDGSLDVTSEELLGSSLFQSLFAPDLDLLDCSSGFACAYGQSTRDGVPDHISFTFGFQASEPVIE